ncbi:putative acyltransferase [Luteibacter sp. Sphag1AF]|uniref:acyltransferase family protein n=1 Tax=Luteibacter sp. Sphag1AF TaxID=2587031 RepID=UPI001612A91A|nr:heparan-alpha-glucosaminide N-acetyltransferase domain-containing protein [Luteibacter sp. Sphag1AF]MBB3227816.1 putative acyltransferase [Luteibacter sp. Sphag1AF]
MSSRAVRYASVDALRGLTVAAMLLVNDPGDWGHVYWPLEHSSWHGCTPTDLIFPLFLFIVGVSITLAIVPKMEAGAPAAPVQRAALWRAVRIVALGFLLNLLAWLVVPDAHLRLPGVLQRIGLCFAAAALLAIHAPPRMQWTLMAVLLVGYALLLQAGGSLEPWTNIASRFDSAVLGSFVYALDPATGRGHDPEGLLSTLPSLATTILGMRAGDWLRRGNLRALLAAAVVSGVAGALLSLWQPLNKNLWTPSYVLWTAGWAMLALATAHYLIDRRGWPALGRAFGVNAIAAYAGSGLMVYLLIGLGVAGPLYQHGFAGWMTPLFGPYVPSLAYGLVFVLVWWLVVKRMDARRIYLKV